MVYSFRVTDVAKTKPAADDQWVRKFLAHLATDRDASVYTQRNYRQALLEFFHWHQDEQSGFADKSASARPAVAWETLQRDDFRGYLRFLGRQKLGRAAIQLRFCALRTFYKFLIRHGVAGASPIKNLALPKQGRRLPKFLTLQQMRDLLGAPVKLMATPRRKGPGRPVSASVCLRDVAVLETIYSCGLRVSELCGLRVEDIDWSGQLVRVRGKGKKERLRADWRTGIEGDWSYWSTLKPPPSGPAPVFLRKRKRPRRCSRSNCPGV
jgi:integrase/recombinase XerC